MWMVIKTMEMNEIHSLMPRETGKDEDIGQILK